MARGLRTRATGPRLFLACPNNEMETSADPSTADAGAGKSTPKNPKITPVPTVAKTSARFISSTSYATNSTGNQNGPKFQKSTPATRRPPPSFCARAASQGGSHSRRVQSVFLVPKQLRPNPMAASFLCKLVKLSSSSTQSWATRVFCRSARLRRSLSWTASARRHADSLASLAQEKAALTSSPQSGSASFLAICDTRPRASRFPLRADITCAQSERNSSLLWMAAFSTRMSNLSIKVRVDAHQSPPVSITSRDAAQDVSYMTVATCENRVIRRHGAVTTHRSERDVANRVSLQLV